MRGWPNISFSAWAGQGILKAGKRLTSCSRGLTGPCIWTRNAVGGIHGRSPGRAEQQAVVETRKCENGRPEPPGVKARRARPYKLAEFPRLYEAAPEYGQGVRRISLAGHHVLYAVDDQAQTCTVLAVVSQRQQTRWVR